ncbi:MAG: hypothetical protein P3B76_10675, partial [Gemmatimonadota bacterium]|nr:hypothetical protein [Gemmatimonadota bacterium]
MRRRWCAGRRAPRVLAAISGWPRWTLAALAQVAGGTCAFELIGVKPVRAFDATVIMVAAFATRDGVVTRIVGAA